MRPRHPTSLFRTFDLMTYAGICKGVWGVTCEEVDLFIQSLYY